MDASLKHTLIQQHNAAKSVLAFRRSQRKRDATALAEVIYDVFKEKKQRERSIIVSGQNNAKQPSNN